MGGEINVVEAKIACFPPIIPEPEVRLPRTPLPFHMDDYDTADKDEISDWINKPRVLRPFGDEKECVEMPKKKKMHVIAKFARRCAKKFHLKA